MTQDELYLTKCKRACTDLRDIVRAMPIDGILVYGSLARDCSE